MTEGGSPGTAASLPVTRTGPSRLRRRLAAALGVGALATGGVALFRTPSVGADTNRPALFSGTAAAAALHEEDNGEAGFAVYQPFYGSFAEGATRYNNDGQSARASTFWPGPTFGNTGSLVCQISCAPIPAYPLSVQTNGPPSEPPSVSQQTSTHVGGAGQPASGTAASADAAADPATGVSSNAVDGGFAAPGASASSAPPAGQLAAAVTQFRREVALLFHQPAGATPTAGALPTPAGASSAPDASATNPAIVAVRSMTASTAQHFVGATLVSDAETDLSGVSLLGGMVDIASVHTESHARTDGAGIHTHTDNVTVSGVTVAGVPATIGSHGITVSGQGTGSALLDSLNADLHQALAAAGADVRLVGATAKPPQPLGGCEGDQADGVFVHTTANAQALPLVGDIYDGDYTLGSSCASGSVTGAGLSVPAVPAGIVTGGGGPPVAGTAAAPPSSGPVGSSAGGASPEAVGGTTGSPSSTARPASRGVATTGLLGPLVSRRFSTLYLSVVLALAAVLVGLGFHVPRPGARGTRPRSGR